METSNSSNQSKQVNVLRAALVIAGVLFLAALIAFIISRNRLGDSRQNIQTLQYDVSSLTDEKNRLTAEKNQSLTELSGLMSEINQLQTSHEEDLRGKDATISALRSRLNQAEQLRRQVDGHKVVEEELDSIKQKYAAQLTEHAKLQEEIDVLEEKIKSLEESIYRVNVINAYNISSLTKWDRWLCPDRYNVSRARRVNETAITFEVAGTPFTETGNKRVYLKMLDPDGDVLNPSAETFAIKATGERSPYTQMKEINFTGETVPMEFTIEHEEKLSPGVYQIQVYVDGVHTRTSRLDFE